MKPSYLFILILSTVAVELQNPVHETRSVRVNVVYRIDPSDAEIIEVRHVKITSYKNVPEETDDTPNIAASSRFVYEGSCAVSPDLKRKYKLRFGDLVYIKKLNLPLVVEDVTHPKIMHTVDIFVHRSKKHLPTIRSDIYLIKFKGGKIYEGVQRKRTAGQSNKRVKPVPKRKNQVVRNQTKQLRRKVHKMHRCLEKVRKL